MKHHPTRSAIFPVIGLGGVFCQRRKDKLGTLSITRRTGDVAYTDGMDEENTLRKAPSIHAVVGKYTLDGLIFEDLENQRPGAGGEIRLTDAIVKGARLLDLAEFGFNGTRFDCGSKADMLRATIDQATGEPACRSAIDELCGLGLRSTRAA